MAITASGERHWRVAASPPGSSYAARNSSGMNSPMLHRPSSTAFHHHSPWGSWRRNASSTSPAGSARAAAAKSGRSGGRKVSVTMYVVPQATGATAVISSVRIEVSSMESNISSLEDTIKR